MRNGVFVLSKEARAWRIDCSMSSGSYSGLAMHEVVHRYEKEFSFDPTLVSSGKAEQ